jgi:Zn-dependent M16 (insulinase) family peptidase
VLAILRDVLLAAHLNNQERLQQLVLKENASKESSLAPRGSHLVDMRLRANLHEADWVEEQIGGISYLWLLRKLAVGRRSEPQLSGSARCSSAGATRFSALASATFEPLQTPWQI